MVPNLYNRSSSESLDGGTDKLEELRNFKTSDKEADAAAGAISAIPVYGQFVAAGMKLGNQIGKRTTDEFGIYKDRKSAIIDQNFNVAAGIQNFKDMRKGGTNAKSVTTLLSGGIFGKSATQQKRQKNIFETKARIARETRANDAKIIQNDQLTATF